MFAYVIEAYVNFGICLVVSCLHMLILVYDCSFYMTYVNIVSMSLVFGTRL